MQSVTDQQMPAMEESSEKVIKGDGLMKLRKELRKWPLRDVQKTQSTNSQQLES